MAGITLHIGAGKCGSTAIQHALTRHPVVPLRDGTVATYCAIDQQGRLVAGAEVEPQEMGRSRKSARHEILAGLPDASMAALRDRLAATPGPVLSSEGYFGASKDGRAFLGRLGLPVHVVAYVRPQVDYVNSAFWQWDAWDGKTRRQWLRFRIKRSQWHNKISQWAAIPEVEKVTVRLLPRDVVADFLGVLGAEADAIPRQPRTNESLPGAVLRFLQLHPGLRERYAYELIWVLPKVLQGHDLGPVPWLVTPDMAERVIRDAKADNERLLAALDAESAQRMLADQRWWDAGAYADRVAEPLLPSRADRKRIEALTVSLFEAAMRMAAKPD